MNARMPLTSWVPFLPFTLLLGADALLLFNFRPMLPSAARREESQEHDAKDAKDAKDVKAKAAKAHLDGTDVFSI